MPSRWFSTRPTLTALRLGEVLDVPLAVCTPRGIHRRDTWRELPDDRGLRRIARHGAAGWRTVAVGAGGHAVAVMREG